jgi:hypothetical protein
MLLWCWNKEVDQARGMIYAWGTVETDARDGASTAAFMEGKLANA